MKHSEFTSLYFELITTGVHTTRNVRRLGDEGSSSGRRENHNSMVASLMLSNSCRFLEASESLARPHLRSTEALSIAQIGEPHSVGWSKFTRFNRVCSLGKLHLRS